MKTTHTYPQPHDYYLPEFIDLAPLEAAYRGYVFCSGCCSTKLGSGKPFGETPRPHPSRAQIISRAANLKKAKQALFQKACRMTPKRRSFEMLFQFHFDLGGLF